MSTLLEEYLVTHCWFECDVSKKYFYMTLTATRKGHLFEILPDDRESRFDALNHARLVSKLTSHFTDYAALFGAACSVVTDVVDYDRSMVYQFQEDMSGKIVYERIRPALEGNRTLHQHLFPCV